MPILYQAISWLVACMLYLTPAAEALNPCLTEITGTEAWPTLPSQLHTSHTDGLLLSGSYACGYSAVINNSWILSYFTDLMAGFQTFVDLQPRMRQGYALKHDANATSYNWSSIDLPLPQMALLPSALDSPPSVSTALFVRGWQLLMVWTWDHIDTQLLPVTEADFLILANTHGIIVLSNAFNTSNCQCDIFEWNNDTVSTTRTSLGLLPCPADNSSRNIVAQDEYVLVFTRDSGLTLLHVPTNSTHPLLDSRSSTFTAALGSLIAVVAYLVEASDGSTSLYVVNAPGKGQLYLQYDSGYRIPLDGPITHLTFNRNTMVYVYQAKFAVNGSQQTVPVVQILQVDFPNWQPGAAPLMSFEWHPIEYADNTTTVLALMLQGECLVIFWTASQLPWVQFAALCFSTIVDSWTEFSKQPVALFPSTLAPSSSSASQDSRKTTERSVSTSSVTPPASSNMITSRLTTDPSSPLSTRTSTSTFDLATDSFVATSPRASIPPLAVAGAVTMVALALLILVLSLRRWCNKRRIERFSRMALVELDDRGSVDDEVVKWDQESARRSDPTQRVDRALLQAAIAQGDVLLVDALLEELEGQIGPMERAWHLLAIACKHNQADMLELLLASLSAGFDLRHWDTEGWCACHWASSVGALDCLEVLLARAPLHLADLTRTGDSIWTIAILTNQMAVIELLVRRDEDSVALRLFTTEGSEQALPMNLAASAGNSKVASSIEWMMQRVQARVGAATQHETARLLQRSVMIQRMQQR